MFPESACVGIHGYIFPFNFADKFPL